MEVGKLELIYNGHHICYHLQLMNMDSHITHIPTHQYHLAES